MRAIRAIISVALGAMLTTAPPAAADAVPSGMSPAVATVGQTVTIAGTGLVVTGYSVKVEFRKKYRATGESPVASVTPASASATAITFAAPANAQPGTFVLRYREVLSPTTTIKSVTTTRTTLSTFTAPVPGTLHVNEPPEVLGSSGILYTSAPGGLPGDLFKPGAADTFEITGRNLVPQPGGLATFQVGGVTYSQVAPARYDSAAGGRDFLTVRITEPAASFRGELKVTKAGMTGVRPNGLVARRPIVLAVEEINASNAVVAAAGGILVRGRRYQVRGTDLAFPAAAPFEFLPQVQLQTTALAADPASNATRAVFTVPAGFAANSATLSVTALGGSVTAGTFAIGDGGMAPPPLAGFVLSPSPAVHGTTLTATISFAGSIPAGADLGGITLTTPRSDEIVGLPKVVPITANPLVVTLPTYLKDELSSVTVTARLQRLTGGTNELAATAQLGAIAITGLALADSSVHGGQSATLRITYDFPEGAGPRDCGSLFSRPDAAVHVESSDGAVQAVIDDFVQGGGFCVEDRVQEIRLHTDPVPQARNVTITATTGASTRTTTLTLLPPELQSVSLNRTALTSMQSATGTLQLSSPMSGAFALLASSDAAVAVPAKVSFGTTSQLSFPVTTLPVPASRSVTLSAAVNGVTRTTTLDLQPLQFQSLAFSPASVRGGSNVAATLSLNTTIDLPFTAQLASSDPAVVTVPAGAAFAAGQNAAVFNVQTAPGQTQNREVTITATYTITLPDGTPVTATKSAVLTVTP